MVIVQKARRVWVWGPIIYRCSNIFLIHLNIRFSLIENLRFYIRRLSTRCSRYIMNCSCQNQKRFWHRASGIRHYLTMFSFSNCKIWFSSLKMTCVNILVVIVAITACITLLRQVIESGYLPLAQNDKETALRDSLFIYFYLVSYIRTQWVLNPQPHPPPSTYKEKRF